MIYGSLILASFLPIVNISEISRADKFEQIMNSTFSLFSKYALFLR